MAAGYFGSLLVARLATPGNHVRVLDLNDASDRPPAVEFVQGDVRDTPVVRAAVEGIDVVMNNVAQVPLARDAAPAADASTSTARPTCSARAPPRASPR